MALEKPVPPALSGLREAVFVIRNLVRSPAAARENGTIPRAQTQAKDELERMKNDGLWHSLLLGFIEKKRLVVA